MKIPNDFNNRINGSTSVNHFSSGSAVTSGSVNKKECGKSLYAYRPINFQGIDTIAFIGELKSLDNMHCPLCGTKMLSAKEYQQCMKEADGINTPEEFCNYLEKYSDNIVPEMKNIVKDSKLMFYKLRNPEMEPFLTALKEGCSKKTAQVLEKTNENFDNIIKNKNLTTNDKKILSDCQKEINYLYQNKSRQALLKYLDVSFKNTVKLLQNQDKTEIYKNISNKLKIACRQELLFDKGTITQSNNEKIQKTVLKNLFHYSKSDIHKVNTSKDAQKGSILNMMLSCEYCAAEQRNIYKLTSSEETQYYYKHLQELADAALQGKLESNKSYPITLASFVRDTSNDRLNPDDNDAALKQLSGITGVKKEREINFELVKHNGIPCASCGQETITHDKKCELFEEVKNSNSMYEIAKILDDNKNIIKKRYLPIAEEFKDLLIKHPYASETDILDSLRQHKYEQIKEALFNCISMAATSANINNYDEQNQNLVNEYIENIQKIILEINKDTKFDYNKYYQITQSTLGALYDNNRNKSMLLQKVITPIKELYGLQAILFPEKEVAKKVGNEIKVIAQDIFKNSVATINLIDTKTDGAKNILKTDSKGRKIVLCKSCSSAKRDKTLKYWYKLHPEMKQNLPKNLRKVEELIKNKEITGFEYYPYEILENVRKSTDGELDIPLSSL